MERPNLDEWFIKTDALLAEEGMALDALKKVVEENGLDNQDPNQLAVENHNAIEPKPFHWDVV
jgi:hypothetical protein